MESRTPNIKLVEISNPCSWLLHKGDHVRNPNSLFQKACLACCCCAFRLLCSLVVDCRNKSILGRFYRIVLCEYLHI
jgi:hypothetical protein